MSSVRILVVDDNSIMRRTLCELLMAQSGFEVVGEAGDGQEAIARAEALRPNLIVMDHLMPLMSGLEAARALKLSMPQVLVILFTAYADQKVEESAQGAGIDAVVSKDEGVRRLVRTAHRLVGA
jgi:CheY-like chemotaxis protein